MSQENSSYKIFENGSTWLKADFHLHTRADQKEFVYNQSNTEYPPENTFPNEYVAKLKKQNIRVGVITNHNKFDKGEFDCLKQKAGKEEILLLPGVELSVNDGSNGIHTLIVFSKQWLENGNDYISPFISSMFPGKAENEYQNENGRSDKNILQVVEELEKTNRDYFLIFAHVEQKSGLWEEMRGGKLGDFAEKRYSLVRQKTLGFQKVRTADNRNRVKAWLKDWYPAEVEGSDCKSIDEIGSRNVETWLKSGDFSFEAIKYALCDYKNRIKPERPKIYQRSYIKNISFEGGILDGQQVNFSPELNSLIGIRGSGKSSLIETIRYLLNIPFGEKTTDQKYKNRLVVHSLGSGGKAIIQAIDKHGQSYSISRILNEQPEVFMNGNLQPGVAIRETILRKPIYFGQKDLSSTGEGFEKDLVERLVGGKLYEIRRQIEEQKQIVIEQCKKLLNLTNIEEKIKENEEKQQDAEFRLKIFKDNGIQEKLLKQTDFNADHRKINRILSDTNDYENALSNVVNQYEDELKNHFLYKSRQNEDFFKEFFKLFKTELDSFDKIKGELAKIKTQLYNLKEKEQKFGELKKEQSDKFAEIRRKLEADLKEKGKTLNLEEFPRLQKIVETTKLMLDTLKKESEKGSVIKDELVKAVSKLNNLWHKEYKSIDEVLKKVNENHTSLKISGEYKGEKTSFLEFFKTTFKGSKLRESTFEKIIAEYSDFAAIFNDFENAKNKAGSSQEIFEKYFFENLQELLIWQVPNKFIIKYRNKELQHHSLGQRASALILFVLSQKENDVVIIDQPEDDLDNQTIYEDVIKLIMQLKPKTQFIFATHNANFPVLGDSEQIHSCMYADEKITLTSGSIDSPIIQQEIVDIMEGGEDAFNKRKEIYRIWKPLNL